jgi:phage gp36-like protein
MPLNLIYFDLARLNGVVPMDTLVQLTNDVGGATIDEDVLNAAATRAANVIASFFFEDYELPFAPVPPVVADIATKLTLVILWERRDAANVPETILEMKRGLEREMNRLRESGIPGATLKDGGTAFEAYSNKTKDDRVFRKDVMDTYRNFPL